MLQNLGNDIGYNPSYTGDSTMDSTPCILLAEQDDSLRRILRSTLNKYGYSVVECTNGIDLLNRFGALSFPRKPENIDLIISEMCMPGVSGIELLEGVGLQEGFPPFIMISTYRDRPLHRRARKFGAVSVLTKPLDIDELLAKVIETVPPVGHRKEV